MSDAKLSKNESIMLGIEFLRVNINSILNGHKSFAFNFIEYLKNHFSSIEENKINANIDKINIKTI